MVCKNCGADVGSEYRLCPYCGTEMEYPNTPKSQPIVINNVVNATAQSNVNSVPVYAVQKSSKSRIVALIVCIFLGVIGGHCFYVGKVGMGILYLFTCGLFCIGWIHDIIKIASGTYRDGNGFIIT